MNKPEGTRARSLLATLSVTGASLAGIAGLVTGGLLGTLAAVPVTAAAVGYSMGGWASAVTGLVLGSVANFWPLYKKTVIIQPATADTPAIVDHETVRLCDYTGDVGALTGGIVGAFTGAAVGAALAGVVAISEAHQALLNSEGPRDDKPRRDDRDNGPFFH